MHNGAHQGDASDKMARFDRPSSWVELTGNACFAALDLRSAAPSANRDRSAHRRSAWLYDDLLN